MKINALAYAIGLSIAIGSSVCADVILFDISPAPGIALSSANYALGDHTLGLSAPNAVGQPASPATGDEIGAGITFDDATNLLSWNIGYGSDHGFVDLLGDFTIAHIHGQVPVQFPAANTGAGVRLGLTHTAGSSPNTGSFTGSATLTAGDAALLLANLLYINVHSTFAGGGEIRGQLVAVVPEPSVVPLFALGSALMIGIRWRRRNQRILI